MDAQNGVKQSSDTPPELESALLKSSLELSQHVAQLVTELQVTNHFLKESARHTAMLLDELAADRDEDDDDSRNYLDGSPRR